MRRLNIFITKHFVLFFLLITFQAANAKDPLIPSNLNGKSKATQFDYNNFTKKLLSTLPKHKRVPPGKKQVYGYNPEDGEYALKQYLELLDDKKLDLTPKEKVKKSTTLNFALTDPGKEVKLSEYFNVVDIKTQLKLKCPVTPSLVTKAGYAPKIFNTTNNLRRYTKSPEIAAGDIIYIKGQIRDINCTPIPNAIVKLWHTDAYGMYKNQEDAERTFVGSGMTVADNMGNFSFISVMPEEYETQSVAESMLAPHINLRITHQKFPNIDTRMYFPKHILNNDDEELNSLDEYSQNLVVSELIPVNFNNFEEGYLMLFDITLDGVSAYRSL